MLFIGLFFIVTSCGKYKKKCFICTISHRDSGTVEYKVTRIDRSCDMTQSQADAKTKTIGDPNGTDFVVKMECKESN